MITCLVWLGRLAELEPWRSFVEHIRLRVRLEEHGDER